MLLTKAGEYGIFGVLYLAQQPKGKVISLTEISEAQNVPEPFLAKIFQGLVRKGYVRSRRGVKGGFSLAKKPQKIFLWDLLEICQGEVALAECFKHGRRCPFDPLCPIKETFAGVQQQVIELLSGYTLADLLKKMPDSRQQALLGLRHPAKLRQRRGKGLSLDHRK